MVNCFLLIIILNTFFGWLLIFGVFRIMKMAILKNESLIKKIVSDGIIEELASDNPIAGELESLDLESELSPLLDIRLNQMTQQMASQVPMGDFLISGALGQKLKSKIKEEILKTLPELKSHFVRQITEEFDLKQMIEQKVENVDFSKRVDLVEANCSSITWKLKSLAALFGAFLGLLEAFLIAWFCQF